MILTKLRHFESEGKRIKVGLVGAGAMGLGIAHQVKITPGMELSWVADYNLKNAEKAAEAGEALLTGQDVFTLLKESPVDVFVESTNSIKEALAYCEAALKARAHVVLMNAEVDLAFGVHLKKLAEECGVTVTSDAGDQHGVLAKMIEEVELWGFKVIQAGNIKGFLNQHATVDSLLEEAAKRNLNPVQCCAYTDGSKLNIEMALLSNAYGYLPTQVGMEGPKMKSIDEVLESFDFSKVGEAGSIDYILGSEPNGGVYLVGYCEDELQIPYLKYYKLGDDSPYYVFYRPYHLCHLETPHAIARAFFYNEAYMQAWAGYKCDVYAFAKQDLDASVVIDEAIGSDYIYGMVATVEEAEQKGWVPQCLLEAGANLTKPVSKDAPLTLSSVKILDLDYAQAFYAQHGKDYQPQ